jgi:hypothetical protein
MLHALFYAEFDNTLGPVVLFDAPKGSVSDSVGGSCLFDAISDYSITGPQVRVLYYNYVGITSVFFSFLLMLF